MEIEIINQLGEALKNYRLSRKLTQDELAREIGVSVHSYHQWERQGKKPSVRFMVKIGELLGLSFNEVYQMAQRGAK